MNSLDTQFHIAQRRKQIRGASRCGQKTGRLFIRSLRACLAPFSATVEFPERWSFRDAGLEQLTPPTDLERLHRYESKRRNLEMVS
jgi:hypothetical protein